MLYNWQQSDWRNFQYDEKIFTQITWDFMEMAGQSLGYLNGLSGNDQAESLVTLLVKEAIKTSAIEGELISRVDIISSIRKNLGYDTPTYTIKDKRSEGIAILLVKSRETFDADLCNRYFFTFPQLVCLYSYHLN